MKTHPSLRWLRIAGLGLLVACAGEPTAAPDPIAAPQASWDDDDHRDRGRDNDQRGRDRDRDDNHNGNGWFNNHEPDLRWIARFKTKPAPPNPLNDHKMIGPAGGSLRVGDFEIIIPPGAVRKPINFRIKVPVDPRESIRAFAEFEPHMIFDRPVTIRVPAAATDVSGTPWVLWWSGSFWIPLYTQPTSDGRVETQVWHFSTYGTSRWGKGITTLGG